MNTAAYLEIVRNAARVVQYGSDGSFAVACKADGRDAVWVPRGAALPAASEAIVLIDETEHLDPAQFRALIANAAGALARGGLLVMRTTPVRYTLGDAYAHARETGLRIAAHGVEPGDAGTWYLVARRDPAAGGLPKTDGSVVWEGEFFTANSLAAVNRELVRATLTAGEHDLHILRTEVADHLATAERNRMAQVAAHAIAAPDGADIWIRHPWPPYFDRPPARTYVHMQMWEYGALPRDWVAARDVIDEVWCPSSYVAGLYTAAGFDPAHVRVIPLGIDPSVFRVDGPRLRLPTQKAFRFCYVGGTIERKGIDVLLSAYTRTFTAADDVTLIIKDFGVGDTYTGMNYRALIERITQTPGMPEILYVDQLLESETLASLYRCADAYVHPYRGEGFALPVLEAMACGLAPITTRGGATDDFVDQSVGYPIPATRRAIGHHAHGHDLIDEGWLLEPDVAALAQTMLRVVRERSERLERGRAAAARAATWSWQRSGECVCERIATLRAR